MSDDEFMVLVASTFASHSFMAPASIESANPRRIRFLPRRFSLVVRRADAYLHRSRRHRPISRGRERLQFRRRCALACEVLERHRGLRAHTWVIIVEQLA
jgi:hypothetical protein